MAYWPAVMAPLDDYERSAMADGAEVRFHEKTVLGLGVPVAVGLAGVLFSSAFFVPAAILAGQGRMAVAILCGALGAVVAAVIAVLGILAGVSRVIVTGRALHVQVGVAKRAIPLGSLLSIERGERTVAMARHRARDDLTTGSVGSPVLTIRFTNDKGAEESIAVSTKDPDALRAALGREPPRAAVRARIAEDVGAGDASTEDELRAPVEEDAGGRHERSAP